MTKLKLTYALAALLAGTSLTQAGTITVTDPGGGYEVTSDIDGTTSTSTGGDAESAFEETAKAVNDNAGNIANNASTIEDFQQLFGSVQTTDPSGNASTVQDPLKTGGAANTSGQAQIALIDNNATLQAEWTAYLDHVEQQATAGEEITMDKPDDPVPADYTGVAPDFSTFDQAVTDYHEHTDQVSSYDTFSIANTAGASGYSAAQAFENNEGLANGILASFNAVDAKIGDISTLPSDLQAATPADTTVVSAITTLNEKVGSLSDLNSTFTGTDRDSVVAAVNSNADRITANSDAISSNSSRIMSLEEDVDELQSGVAMAIAMANAPIIQGGYNGFSLSGGFGHFKGKSAGSMKAAFMPLDNMAITASVATDFDDNVAAGAGLGFSF